MIEPKIETVYAKSNTKVCYVASPESKAVTLTVPWLDGYEYYTVEPTTVRKEELESAISYIGEKYPDVVILTTDEEIAKEYGIELLKPSISYFF